VLLTLWLSITPADGDASRPAISREAISKMWFIVSHRPLSRQM
jgi:hypothetical protein